MIRKVDNGVMTTVAGRGGQVILFVLIQSIIFVL
jgi:hypothetical protein